MRVDLISEPQLEFGLHRHIDIRFGLMNYGPVDYASPLAPKQINIGVVGTSESVEGVCRWLEKCRNEIPAKDSRQPCLFPKFPGFRPDIAFQSTLILDGRLQRVVSQRILTQLSSRSDLNQVVADAVDIFYGELGYLADSTNSDVLICAVPQILLDTTHQLLPAIESRGPRAVGRLDFHNLLKARSMAFNKPVQLVIPSTYDASKRRRRRRRPRMLRTLQDEATRAWNLHTALYYKAGGVPWRLIRDAAGFTTCYIGISFYDTLDRTTLLTSVAQVFNERGQGVVVRGGTAQISKEDRQVHLSGDDAEGLLCHALDLYRREHSNYPARVVVHKSSAFSTEETQGFLAAIEARGISMVDMLSLNHTETRLFRNGAYPPLRGVFWSLDEQKHILYTRGSVPFFSTYPGQYVPSPLLFRCDAVEQTPMFLAREIMALTKMNWNNTQFDGGDPITLRAARQVGSILKYIGPTEPVAPGYRFYM